jgi:branched-chain amino acid transport system substrate-binding protein
MSGRSVISTFTIFVLIVGLVVGGGGVYYFTTSQYQPRIAEQEAQIEDLGSQIQSLTARVESLEAENASLVDEISEYEEAASVFVERISDLEEQISFYEATISGLEEEIEVLRAEGEELPDIVDDYEEQISELELMVDFYRSILKSYLPETILIGITASGTASLESVRAVVNITQAEINAYCEKEGFPHRFEFVIRNNREDASEAVGNTMWFHDNGVNLVVGHPNNQECSLAMDYVNSYDMMLLSPSASSRSLSISGDNFYRTCPSELYQAVAIAEALDGMGFEAILVVQKGDEWGEDFYDALEEEFEGLGGVVYERFVYDPEDPKFISVLNRLEAVAQSAIEDHGSGGVAIQVIGSDEVSSLIKDAEAFPTLYGIEWFGTSKIANDTKLFRSVAQEAGQLRLYSPVPVPEEDGRYAAFAGEYRERVGSKPDFYSSAMYDACWLYALTVVEVWTTDTGFVRHELPDVAESYAGASGPCRLDVYGDRMVVDYEFWGYRLEGDEVASERFGRYDASRKRFSFS